MPTAAIRHGREEASRAQSKPKLRSRARTPLLVAAVLGMGNCYEPDLSDCTVRCGDGDACPSDQECDHGHCVRKGGSCPATDEENGGSGGSGGSTRTGGTAGAGAAGTDAGGDGAGGDGAGGSVAGGGGEPSGSGGQPSGAGGEVGGAGSDMGGTGATGGTSFVVVEVSPDADRTSVDPVVDITATFSLPLDPRTVDTNTWTLTLNGTRVSGTVSSEQNRATFRPDRRLALLGEYEASLSTDICAASGNCLATPYEWSFEIRDGAWQTPEFIFDQMTSSNTAVAIDDDENVVAVWWDGSTGRRDMMASRRVPGASSWEPPELIEMDDRGNANAPKVVMLGGGDALAIWQQSDGTRIDIWENRFLAAEDRWLGAAPVEMEDLGNAEMPRLAADALGNAIAVWQQFDGTTTNIWANRFDRASAQWLGATKIESGMGAAESPYLASNAAGDAIVVWSQSNGSFNDAWSNRFDAASGAWQGPERIETHDTAVAATAIALNDEGVAFATWAEFGTRLDVWASRFDEALQEWESGVLLEDYDDGHALDVLLGLDPDGNALAVWQQALASGVTMAANRFRADVGEWGQAASIGSGSGGAWWPQFASDARGNGLAVWHWTENDTQPFYDALANRFHARTAEWTGAASIENHQFTIEGLSLAMNRGGVGVALWSEGDIYAAFFR